MLEGLCTPPWCGKGLRWVSFGALDSEVDGLAVGKALDQVAGACIDEDRKNLEADEVLASPVRREPA